MGASWNIPLVYLELLEEKQGTDRPVHNAYYIWRAAHQANIYTIRLQSSLEVEPMTPDGIHYLPVPRGEGNLEAIS